ncbi:protein PALS2-like isoform X1 [Artemia franciscana]|uniref:MAGUK p55 subfamily member 6 n=1 Tax=Artemia franciscana TaxID=6661 RepID=A0AA88LF31_ARTSF|nr:hypothetical protein QYM36_000926 [Artemia franciscana]
MNGNSAVKTVVLKKSVGEPLGLTVKEEANQLIVSRVLAGGTAERLGNVHIGDIIGKVNGVDVQTPEELQNEIARSTSSVQLQILPFLEQNGHVNNGSSLSPESSNSVSYMRALFDYNPKDDKILPCAEIGLCFSKGDVLQILNRSDPNWWQAKKVGWAGPAGLIPSQELEERRKAFVAPDADFVHKVGLCGTRTSKKKKKILYRLKQAADLDKAELILYEEVTRMPPFRRKTLVLIGTEGIGKRTIKNRLLNSDPDRFGTTMPYTSRPMRELEEQGMGYWFTTKEDMETEIQNNEFLEYGEYNGHLYGTKLDSIRDVIRNGKMCIIDCSPTALKALHNSPEFMPYVIFIAAPGMELVRYMYDNNPSHYGSRAAGIDVNFERASSMRISTRRARTLESLASLYEEEDFKHALEESARMQRSFEKYFDMVIVNEDPDITFNHILEALEALSNQHQWVPVTWVY